MNTPEEQLYENLINVIFELKVKISKLSQEKMEEADTLLPLIKDLARINTKVINENKELKREVIQLTDQNTKLYQQIGLISIDLHTKLLNK